MRCVRFSCVSSAVTLLSLGACLVPMIAQADPREDPQFLHVSISLHGVSSGVPGGSARFDVFPESSFNLGAIASVTRQAALPDSVRFSGLAGRLSLAIDTSSGQPQVQGIALAPHETLRFAAGRRDNIRGIQGQISIQFDF